MKKKFEAALALQQQNDLATAIPLLQSLLQQSPQNSDIFHALGMAYAQQHDFPQALLYLQQAVALTPNIAEFHNNLANVYKGLAQYPLAKRHYQEALRLKTPYPQAHNNLGALLYKLGQYDEAISHFQKAIRMDPLAVDTHYNLANAYIQQDRFIDAKAHYEQVLKQRPEHLGALHNLGITLCVLKHFREAEPLLTQVITREPNNIDALYHLGVISSALAKAESAKTYFSKVIELNPEHANSHHNLATVYLHLQQRDLALNHFEKALALEPSNQTAAHMVAAIRGETLASGAPIGFTRALFDQYAYSYDEHVKKQLSYQVPHLLRQAMAPYSHLKTQWVTLDLGCGSGLCAPYFADLATHITGVDLSPNMLALAKQQGGYDTLVCDDALSYLSTQKPATFDLIIAADVFVYFGSLDDIFSACQRVLKNDGYFAFSIETLQDEDKDYQLTSTGRYAHRPAYIRTLLTSCGLALKSEQAATLRTQDEIPVNGHIFVLHKTTE